MRLLLLGERAVSANRPAIERSRRLHCELGERMRERADGEHGRRLTCFAAAAASLERSRTRDAPAYASSAANTAASPSLT